MNTNYFQPFNEAQLSGISDFNFRSPFHSDIHPLAIEAAEALKKEIGRMTSWQHNFGFDDQKSGFIRGKMFGVLVVQNSVGEIGFLKAFSGKLDYSNHHPGFVPPVFDSLTEGSFLNRGMTKLSEMSAAIDQMRKDDTNRIFDQSQLNEALEARRKFSKDLHAQFYDAFTFVNDKGHWKSLKEIFQFTKNGNPPAGAGECAAPKLYQFAFLNQMQPIALAEFYWGAPISPDSCVHGQYYPSCQDKCLPILTFMLSL